MAKKAQKKAVKKTVRKVVKAPARKSSGEGLFGKHKNLNWLLPILIVVVVAYFLLLK